MSRAGLTPILFAADSDDKGTGTPGMTCSTMSGACRVVDLDLDGDYAAAAGTLFDSLPAGLARHAHGMAVKHTGTQLAGSSKRGSGVYGRVSGRQARLAEPGSMYLDSRPYWVLVLRALGPMPLSPFSEEARTRLPRWQAWKRNRKAKLGMARDRATESFTVAVGSCLERQLDRGVSWGTIA